MLTEFPKSHEICIVAERKLVLKVKIKIVISFMYHHYEILILKYLLMKIKSNLLFFIKMNNINQQTKLITEK